MILPLHKKMTNRELSVLFDFIGGVLALKGEDRFRVRAYQNASAAIDQYPTQLWELFATHQSLDDVPAIGKVLTEKLTEIFTTGNCVPLQEYVADIPEGVWALTPVHGIGVKKAYRLSHAFHLEEEKTAIALLIKHAQAGDVKILEGFGVKSEQDLLVALQNHVVQVRMPYQQAAAIAQKLIKELLSCPAIQQAEALGSLRRETATVGDIDLGIVTHDMDAVKSFVKTTKNVNRMVAAGDQLLRVIVVGDHQVDIKVSSVAEWGSFLQHFTGSKEHNIKLRELALRQGKSLSEHGIKETDNQGLTVQRKFSDEKEFYADLGLRWIEPRERVGGDEIERAQLKG